MSPPDRIRGCLLLGAYGDALGSARENISPNSVEVLRLGSITDDTQLTLATCESICDVRQVSPAHLAATFASWHRQRRFTGLGSSTLKALVELEAGQHWALAGAKGERAAGNGAAMRIAPLAFRLNPFEDDDRRTIRDVCRITHHHDEAYIGALAIAQAIYLVANDEPSLTELLPRLAVSLPDSQVRDRLRELAPLIPQRISIAQIAQQFGNGGFVAESVPLAIYAAGIHVGAVKKTLRDLVMTGGDADTNASLAGQILGAALGETNLPVEAAELFAEIAAAKELIEKFARL
ncbi:ADP-ribosylglycohydrolase family protein [Anatilimnocola sp. NA78]|uniref:ADP-ribosylglycohydrolase family protein n=1 Tax=Anatilimnocola sp. NA78 TaxID=3415683 RepID=UPI003CE46D6C